MPKKLLTILMLCTWSLCLNAQNQGAVPYWDQVLNRYEQLCDAISTKQSASDIKKRTEELQQQLKTPVGSMTQAQRKRFEQIQMRFKGISQSSPSKAESTSHIIQVDTIRSVEYRTVIDTVFVKEILGEVAILQQMSRKDTVVHIIHQEPAIKEVVTHDTIYLERSRKPSTLKKQRHPIYILASAGITPDRSIGVMLAYGGRLGVYLKGRSSFHSPRTSFQIQDKQPVWANGKTDQGRWAVTAGGFIQTTKWLNIYLGAGYGVYKKAWQDVQGNWGEVLKASHRGLALDGGLMVRYRHLVVSVGTDITDLGYADLDLGIGVVF